MLVGVGWKRAPRFPGMPAGEQGRESLSELVELAKSAGAEVAGTVLQVREAADPATVVGRGKVDEIRAEANAHDAPLMIFDSELTPMQQRNLEEAHGPPRDRPHAADSRYFRAPRAQPRGPAAGGTGATELPAAAARRARTELSRLGGGIGTRGPGEQKLETDRRAFASACAASAKTIETLRRQRELRRRSAASRAARHRGAGGLYERRQIDALQRV